MSTRLSLAIFASLLLTPTTVDAAKPQSEASAQRVNTLTVPEEPKISNVYYFGNSKINDRELTRRSSIKSGDLLNEISVELGRRSLIDFYHELGFKRVVVETVSGVDRNHDYVIFRIIEGPRERPNRAVNIEDYVRRSQY